MTEPTRHQSLLAAQLNNCVHMLDLLNERLLNLDDRLGRLELRFPISQSATPELSMDSSGDGATLDDMEVFNPPASQ